MAEEIGNTLHFRLKLDGCEGSSLFTEANGGGSLNVVIDLREGAELRERKSPGPLEFNDITLKRGVDPDRMLWDWRQQVVDGKITDARRSGTLEILDSTFAHVVSYAFDRGWPSKYTAISMNTGQDQPPVEEITIVVENFRRE